MAAMHWVLLFCSDDDCTEVYEAWGSEAELAALVCDCGVGLETIGVPEPIGDAADGVPLVLLPA